MFTSITLKREDLIHDAVPDTYSRWNYHIYGLYF